MSMIVIENVDIFDGISPEIKENHHVAIEGRKITEISHREINFSGATRISGAGKTLMPGMIDAHFHACLVKVKGYDLTTIPASLLYPAAANLLENTLRRGFTTIRDAGGADFGLAEAVTQGFINGPRIFFSGRPITQTGGHGEIRPKSFTEPCLCSSHQAHMVAVVDGVDELRKVVREEFRKGAHQIKLMLNGGVSTEADPVWLCQFTDAEIRAVVEETTRRKSYVMAHLYMDKQIRKAVDMGIRSVEHGNFLELETARFMAERKAFLVPTLVTYAALKKQGRQFGFTEDQLRKLDEVAGAGLQSLENAARAQVKIGFGTDLLGDMHSQQCEEFLIRSEIQSPFEILKSATSINAEIIGQEGVLGVVSPDAQADLILVDGNPLQDLTVFNGNGSKIAIVIKDGRIVLQN
ncbi:Prolidase [hydrothermal vent metagenome]|uniref:Prolidase n=1 Tax=hydrothermal vent metagenome TaxID=652676 RepID=A0A3B0SAV0_9ZZZZ